MHVRIEGHTLPGLTCGPSPEVPEGYANIHVGVQRGREVVDLVPADATAAIWDLEVTTRPREDRLVVGGPYVHGRGDDRFIYLSWGTVDAAGTFTMFRRAKLRFADVDPALLHRAAQGGTLVARLGLTDNRGNPLCARVGPSTVTWALAPATSTA